MEFGESDAFRNGEWLPMSRLSWSVTDIGTTQGAILVERLRTLGRRVFALEEHLQRLFEGAQKLGIAWNPDNSRAMQVCEELLERNRELVNACGDVGIVIVVSPGDPGIDRRPIVAPTMMVHLSPISFDLYRQWYRFGAKLFFSPVRNVPPECWSPSIKTRSRLQYYLADQSSHGRVAVLLNTRGMITETSISNLLVLGKDGVLKSPPLEDILHGVSLKTVIELANSISIPVQFGDLEPVDLQSAAEVLMTGTTGCIWSAVEIDSQLIGDGKPGVVCRRLQDAWEERVSYRFTQI
jgi:branched-chain amino acid aminotransferase